MHKHMDKIKKIISVLLIPFTWFFSSFSGADGKASGKKITACFFTLVTGRYVMQDKVKDLYSFYAFACLLIVVLLMWSIITFSNIKSLARILKDKEDKG